MENQTENIVRTENSPDKQQPLPLKTEIAPPLSSPAPSGKRKWQLASLLMCILFILAIGVIGLVHFDSTATKVQRDRLMSENQSLREQLAIAGTQITEYKNQIDSYQNRNTAQSRSPFPSVQSAPAPTGHIEVKKKSTVSRGTTRNELISALGEPDRVYKSRGYEQLVYFGRSPGRFWLIGDQVVQVGG